MENADVVVIEKDQMPEETQVKETVVEKTEERNGTVPSLEDEDVIAVENKDSEAVVTKPVDEQENVTETNVPASVSPARANLPFKEVNESEGEECTTASNGTETINNKKREFDHDADEEVEEKNLDDNDRAGDSSKKIKVAESTETPSVDANKTESTVQTNGTATVEV